MTDSLTQERFDTFVDMIRKSMELGLHSCTNSLTESFAEFCSESCDKFETDTMKSIVASRRDALQSDQIDTVLCGIECDTVMLYSLNLATGDFKDCNKVACIRDIRNFSGASLKEAKEFCERVRDQVQSIG